MNLEIDGLGFYTEKYGFLSSTGDGNTTGNPCSCLRQKAEGPNFLTIDSPSQHPEGDWGPILSCCPRRPSRSLPRVTPVVVIKADGIWVSCLCYGILILLSLSPWTSLVAAALGQRPESGDDLSMCGSHRKSGCRCHP